MSARGFRNNNPTNIRASGVHWEGELTPDADGFCVFDTPEHGIGAAGQNLKAYRLQHGLKTVDSIIRRWSATDQDVYVANVAKALGVRPDDEINVLNPDTLFRLVCAIIRQENGVQPYTYAVICAGLGIGPPIEEVQPAAPIEDHTASPEDVARVGGADNSNALSTQSAGIVNHGGPVPFVPIMLSLLPSILNLFAPRAQAALQKVTGQPPDVVQQFAQSLFDKLGQLTGTTDPIQATAAITANPEPAKVADLQEHALDYMDKLGPILDKLATYDDRAWQAEENSRSAASARGLQAQEAGPLWSNPTFLIAVFVLVLVATVVCAVLFKGGFSTDMQAFVIGAIVGSALTAVLGFYFGSSRSSSAKDVLIGEMARRQPQGQ